ncbi:MAG: ABC transporter ATP-binding protein [Bacteriovoracaceae bacterium]|jgi:ABC-2 type transport system ATP-binding protein|nr:ABC transporter ATP-binding protein [Bacteriovoracaceae bacterium]
MSDISTGIAIELKNISKSYPGVQALKAVNLKVKKGTIHGFLGPNGAGKSTTLKVISGLITADSGEVNLDGSLGFLPDTPPLYQHMSVRNFLEFVYDIESLDQSKTEAFKNKQKAIDDVLIKTGLTEVSDRFIGHLSKGYQQRVGIAEALVHSPNVIILDEPTVGLDPVAINEIRKLISELKKEHTILFSSHLLHEVELLCDEISIISQGEILLTGKIADIKQKFQGVFHTVAVTRTINEAQILELIKMANIDDYKVFQRDHSSELHLYSSTDTREKISDFLVTQKCGLLELRPESVQLEEIFKRMMNQSEVNNG